MRSLPPARSRHRYSWNHLRAAGASAATSSMEVVPMVESANVRRPVSGPDRRLLAVVMHQPGEPGRCQRERQRPSAAEHRDARVGGAHVAQGHRMELWPGRNWPAPGAGWPPGRRRRRHSRTPPAAGGGRRSPEGRRSCARGPAAARPDRAAPAAGAATAAARTIAEAACVPTPPLLRSSPACPAPPEPRKAREPKPLTSRYLPYPHNYRTCKASIPGGHRAALRYVAGPARAASVCAARARSADSPRSASLRVSAAARSNSARASSGRPSFISRSPRTLGSR